ncbi:MAG: hypothetical protein JRM79_05230 [Nitrososphaerota archaeon]|nr:hypothetical protein [Nitrososphaerota archaeon]MCL5671873.1 hypothetical protein [Nitrososphaerota archaeon]MDG6899664.1 hypothetical protein [Nitrososphaerota archaeon]MDG6911464.1 hypothetical protein [Nitrososphaerota archaeon]MDG6920665.1 hypothetical protein [Nitrososphaerota archaeon]
MAKGKIAISNVIFASVTIILLVIAAGGFALYTTKQGAVTTTTATSVETTTLTSNRSVWFETGGLYNGQVVTFVYPRQYACTPSLLTFFPNQTAAASQTSCEVGAGNGNAEAGAVPLWVVVPAYAGLSVFGVKALGASPQGYPVFDNQTIITDCGASGTPSGCPDHPLLLYSPFFTAVEQHLGITNGYGGLPEGVLPTPAHDHLINCCFQVIPWYTVVVLNFDPNIQPNPVTGQCSEIVPSSLANATADCLNNYSALVNALTTHNSAISQIDANNPIWQTLGGPTTQVVVPGAATAVQLNNANTNLFEHFTVNSTNFYLQYKG